MKVYINGVLKTSQNNVYYDPPTTRRNTTMHLGKPTEAHWWHGNFSLDDLFIWNYEKNERQMMQLPLQCKYQRS